MNDAHAKQNYYSFWGGVTNQSLAHRTHLVWTGDTRLGGEHEVHFAALDGSQSRWARPSHPAAFPFGSTDTEDR